MMGVSSLHPQCKYGYMVCNSLVIGVLIGFIKMFWYKWCLGSNFGGEWSPKENKFSIFYSHEKFCRTLAMKLAEREKNNCMRFIQVQRKVVINYWMCWTRQYSLLWDLLHITTRISDPLLFKAVAAMWRWSKFWISCIGFDLPAFLLFAWLISAN